MRLGQLIVNAVKKARPDLRIIEGEVFYIEDAELAKHFSDAR